MDLKPEIKLEGTLVLQLDCDLQIPYHILNDSLYIPYLSLEVAHSVHKLVVHLEGEVTSHKFELSLNMEFVGESIKGVENYGDFLEGINLKLSDLLVLVDDGVLDFEGIPVNGLYP